MTLLEAFEKRYPEHTVKEIHLTVRGDEEIDESALAHAVVHAKEISFEDFTRVAQR